MNDITEMIIDSTNKIMKDICTKELINESEKGKWAADLWDMLAHSGMITVAIPEERGGNGGDFSDALSILRLAGKYSAPIPLAETYVANWLLNQLGAKISEEPLTIALPSKDELFSFKKNKDGWIISGESRGFYYHGQDLPHKCLVIGTTESEHVLGLIKPKYGEYQSFVKT